MAKVLDDHEFKGTGPRAGHDYDQYELGKAYRIERGEDFEATPDVFRKRLYAFAKSRGYSITTEIDGDAVIFRMSK